MPGLIKGAMVDEILLESWALATDCFWVVVCSHFFTGSTYKMVYIGLLTCIPDSPALGLVRVVSNVFWKAYYDYKKYIYRDRKFLTQYGFNWPSNSLTVFSEIFLKWWYHLYCERSSIDGDMMDCVEGILDGSAEFTWILFFVVFSLNIAFQSF